MILLGALFAWVLRAVMVDPVPVEIDPIPIDPIDPIEIEALDYPPPWLPDATETQIYTGAGVRPEWNDVYRYTDNEFTSKLQKTWQISDISEGQDRQFVTDAVRTAMGETIRSLSGFVNQTVDLMQHQFTQLYSTLQFVFHDFDVRNHDQDIRIQNLQREVNGLATIVAAEERQIVALRETIFDAVEFEGEYLKAWIGQHVTEPLLRAIIEEQQHRDVAILRASRNVLDQAHEDVLRTVAPVAAGVAVATRLATAVQSWVDDCGEPMCQTMGPKTDLGKLLKVANLAALAALLAEVAALRADGLNGLVGDVAEWGTRVITDFESMFFTGGKTLGEVIGSLPG